MVAVGGSAVNVGVQLGVMVGVCVGVLLGGRVGVIKIKLDLVVGVVMGVVSTDVEIAMAIGGGVALKARVGAGVVGASVTSCTNKGPLFNALRSGLHATSSIINIKPINGRLPILMSLFISPFITRLYASKGYCAIGLKSLVGVC